MTPLTADVLETARDWTRAGRSAALATVVRASGSAPCPPGSALVVDDAGHFAGSVSGGCVESAVIESAGEVMSTGRPRVVEFGITDERAWEVGLPCGGTVRIFVQPVGAAPGITVETLDRMIAARVGGVAFAVLTGVPSGTQRTGPVGTGSIGGLDEAEQAAVHRALQTDRCELLHGAAGELFVQVFQRRPRIIIVGAVHIAQHLALQAKTCGHEVTVLDPRAAFAGPDRFPGMDVCTDWPDKGMIALHPDRRTAVVVLSHDPKLDDPALSAALRSEAYYIGALGSRKNHAARLARLRSQGFTDGDLARIHGPVGLDIGAGSPAEISVAIMAELIQVLRS